MRVVALVVLACASCATIDTAVVNENYDPPTRARARSQTAMDSVRHGEDPCADQADNRPAIESVVHTEEGDDTPIPDDGTGCKVWGPLRLTYVTVRGAKAFTPAAVGAFALMLLDEENAQQSRDDDEQRKAKDRALLQQQHNDALRRMRN